MARFLVEILINAAGGPKARASFDDVGASAATAAKRIEQSGLQSERALRRTAEAAERLKDQMEETKASKGLIADLTTLNTKLNEELRAVQAGASGIDRLNKKRHEEALAARVATAQVKAGVAAHSDQGKAINRLVREHDHLQSELRQTLGAQDKLNNEFRGTIRISDQVASHVGRVVLAYAGFSTLKRIVYDSFKAFSDYEAGLIGVAKTANLSRKETEALGAALDKQLKTTMPSTAASLLVIAEAAGSVGVEGVKSIENYVTTLAKLEKTSDIVGAEGAQALARLQNVLGESTDKVDELGSSIVALGNKLPATEAQILHFGGEIARATGIYDVSSHQAVALGAAMASIGIQAELGRSAVGDAFRFIESAVKGGGRQLEILSQITGMTGAQLKETFERDAVEAFTAFLGGINRLQASGQNIPKLLESIKLGGDRNLQVFPALAKRIDLVTSSLNTAAAEYKSGAALQEEFDRALESTESQMQLLSNTADSLRRSFGRGIAAGFVKELKDIRGELSSEALASDLEDLGKDVGRFLGDAAKAARDLAASIKEIDSSAVAELAGGLLSLIGTFAKVQKASEDWGYSFNPLLDYSIKAIEILGKGLRELPRAWKNSGAADLFSGKPAPKQPNAGLFNLLNNKGQLLSPGGAAPVSGIFGDVSGVKEFQTEIEKTGDTIDIAGKKADSARESFHKMMKELVDSEAAQMRSTAAARESTAAYKAETLAQEQAAKVEKLREAAQKAGIPWTEKNTATVYALVKSLRELKVQEDAALKSRELMLEVKIDTSALDQFLADTAKKQVELDLEWRRSAFSINQQNQDAFAQQRADVQAQLEEQASYFRQSLITPREELDTFLRHIESLRTSADEAGNALLSAAEAERLRTDAIADYLSQSLSAWEQFFSYLGNAFGGVAQKIANSLQAIQSGYQTGSSLGSMSSMGAGAGGGAGAIVALVIETYKWMKSEAEKRKAESYNFGASLVKGAPGQDWNIAVDDEARRASLQIKKTIEALAESLGGVVESFASLEIKVRRDGEWIHAFINGQFVGYFKDMQSAIEAAILAGLKDPKTMFSGMSDLVRQGLEYILSPGTVKVDSLEELEDFMSKIKEISDIRLGPAAEALSAIRHIDRLWEALGKIPAATAAVIQGIEDLRMAEISVWQDLFDSITGRQKSQAEIRAEKERDLKIAKAELEIRKAQIQQRMLQIQADILALKSNNGLIGGGGGRGGGGPKTGSPGAGGIIGLTYAFAMAGNVVAQTTALVTGASTGMIEALEAEWKGLEELLKGLSELKIPDIGAITGGGRGGTDERQGVRDFIKDKKFELSLAGASDYKRALAELDRTYEPLLKSAGKDNALKAELIALREKERKLIEEERKRTLAEKFNQFMGIDQDPFSQLRKGAADLIKEIEDSPFGNARKQRMIARIFADLERQIDRLARQQAASILGELIGDMERFGATDAQMAQARQAMAILEHTLKMEHYRTEIEILRATGKLAPEVMATIDNAFRFLEGVDPLQFVGPRVPLTSAKGTGVFRGYGDDAVSGAGNQLSDTLRRTNDALKKFRDILQDIADDNRELLLSDDLTALSPQARRDEAIRQYEDVYQRALGGDASALRQYTQSRQQLLEIERQYSASGPEYAALFERVLREGGALALSADVQEKGVASLLAEQTDNDTENAEMIHADLLALRSSIVDGLAGLSAALGQGNLLNGIPRFAAGGITSGPSLAGEGPYREAVVPLPGGRAIPVELRGGQTDSADSVRLLGVIATEITALRASQETANQRLIRLENAAQRSASIRETFDKRTV